MRDPNKMAGVNSHFKMSIKSTLNGFLLQMLRSRLGVVAIILCIYTKTFSDCNILALFTSISNNNC